MSATDDVTAFLQMLDQMGQKCIDDPAYRQALIDGGLDDLSDVGASAVVLAEILVRQGADGAEVAGFMEDDFDPGTDGIVWRNKKTVVRCITHGPQSGRSCRGKTVILNGGGAGTKMFTGL
jgi:hypothetical protein